MELIALCAFSDDYATEGPWRRSILHQSHYLPPKGPARFAATQNNSLTKVQRILTL
jgi:hypothetical protein